MDEKTVLNHIDELVAEEKALRAGHPDGLSDGDRARLHALEVQLDQAWDLLRRRRAQAEAGEATSATRERPAAEVEGYLQ